MMVDEGLLTKEQLETAVKDAAANGGSVSAAAVRLNLCSEDAIGKMMASMRGTKFVDVTLLKPEIMDQLVKLVPADIAQKYRAIPVGKKFTKFTFAVVDPLEPSLIRLNDDLFRGKPGEIELWVSGEGMIQAALEKYFPGGKKPAAAAQAASGGSGLNDAMAGMGAIAVAEGPEGGTGGPAIPDVEVVADPSELQDPDGDIDQAPVIQFVNKIIYEAVERKASDIHLDPNEAGMVLRYRIDGVLHDISQIPKQWRRAIAAVVKVKTKQMKIEERRRPQDAKIKIKVPGQEKPIDLRVSTLPIVWGEKIVMRILNSSNLPELAKLGFEPDELEKLMKAVNAPQGMVIVTGPTGSGKTNTLYSALNTVNVRTKNIMTAENPVEFQLPGINQVQINIDAGMTFAAALKAFLRQDPNIILVGEVRDFEEVDIAVKAAMTGHMVLTTLHTNDAPSTVSRLLDMRDPVTGAGVDSGIIATAVNIIVAQRLMRTICKACKEPEPEAADKIKRFGLNPKDFEGITVMHGKGCPVCNKTGNKGRTGIFEVMSMTRTLRDMVMARKDANALRDEAIKEGMSTLRQSAIKKVRAGISTIEEIMEATIE